MRVGVTPRIMRDELDTLFVAFYFWSSTPDMSILEWVFSKFDKGKTKIVLTNIYPTGDSYKNMFIRVARNTYLPRCRAEQFQAEILTPLASQPKEVILELLTKHEMKELVMNTNFMSEISPGHQYANFSYKILSIQLSNNKMGSIWQFGPDLQDAHMEVQKFKKMANDETIRRINIEEKLTEQVKINEQLKQSLSLSTYITFQELQQATQNFSDSLKIGEGGSGSVYKGTFRGTNVAIKKLKYQNNHGLSEFQKEVVILSTIRHPNLVTLMGTCSDPPALVYEYLSNESLHDQLTHTGVPFPWQTRTRIIGEICLALIFLHSNKPNPIVHGDLKPYNVFLDANFTSKLSDFGLIKQAYMDNNNLFRTTDPERTFAYMDPRFLKTGKMTKESDVYSFGVIILRLITGKTPLDIRETVEESMGNNQFSTLIDEYAGKWPLHHAQEMAKIGIRCAHDSWTKRPHLANEVWPIIEGLLKFPDEAT